MAIALGTPVATLEGVSRTPAVIDSDAGLRRDLDLLLLDAARLQAWERLLFVGCGDGWIAEEAWRRVLRGYACGVDRSPALVARATELRGVPGRLDFATWDGNRLPCDDGSFHRVFSTFALGGESDLTHVVGEMFRVLEPGGELYAFEYDRRAIEAGDATPAFAAALRRAGFVEPVELVRRNIDHNGSGRLHGVIVRGCRAAPATSPSQPLLAIGDGFAPSA